MLCGQISAQKQFTKGNLFRLIVWRNTVCHQGEGMAAGLGDGRSAGRLLICISADQEAGWAGSGARLQASRFLLITPLALVI